MKRCLFLLLALWVGSGVVLAACYGRVLNPVTDIPWDGIFPITVAGARISETGINHPRTDAAPVCACQKGPILKAGVNLSFFEPIRTAEVVREPFCFPSLGGITLDPGLRAPAHGRSASRGNAHEARHTAFYQAHWYVSPWFFILETILDAECLEQSPWDMAYMTEVDPMWDDAWASFVLAPESALFANSAAVAACAADCATSTTGSPSPELFWCAGCQGSLYPLSGWIAAMTNPVSAWHLVAERLAVKLAREGVLWAAYGKRGQCGPYFEPIPRKDVWRTSLIYPVSDRRVRALGASVLLGGPGQTFPVKGEDGAILLWRLRDCCAGYGP